MKYIKGFFGYYQAPSLSDYVRMWAYEIARLAAFLVLAGIIILLAYALS